MENGEEDEEKGRVSRRQWPVSLSARCLLTAACIPADDGLSSLPRCVGSPSVLVCVLLGPNASKRHRGHRSQGSQLRASAAGETGTYVCVCARSKDRPWEGPGRVYVLP